MDLGGIMKAFSLAPAICTLSGNVFLVETYRLFVAFLGNNLKF